MTFFPKNKEKICLKACSNEQVQQGLCDCFNNAPKFNNKMENFFYEDNFYPDFEDFVDDFSFEKEHLSEIKDDWEITCEESSLEKIFNLKKEFIIESLIDACYIYDDRIPSDSDHIFNKIRTAISKTFDVEKLNENLPSLYYPNGKKFKITKKNIVDYFS